MLISLEIFSLGLKVTNNLASLLTYFGASKTGTDWAKHTFPEASETTITSQSLNLPIFLRSEAKAFDREATKNMIENKKVFLIKDMGLDKFFVLR